MANLQVRPSLFNQARLLTASGFHATTATEFAEAFEEALALEDKLAMRLRARESAKRFTEEEFAKRWVVQMEKLVILRQKKVAALAAK
jgi:alpha-1,2-mannosyltransferase